MTLRDIKIGDKFKFANYGNLVWIKRTEQGMDNLYSYCETEKKIKNKARHSTKWKLFKQDLEVIPQ